MNASNEVPEEDVDAALLAYEEGRALLVEGVLALKDLENKVTAQIQEREDAEAPKSVVHPLRSAHAALIAARKELVMAEQRTASRLRSLHRQQV